MSSKSKKKIPQDFCKTWEQLQEILVKNGGEDEKEAGRIAGFWKEADYLFGSEEERTGDEPMMALAWCALGIAYPSITLKWQKEFGSLGEGYNVAKAWIPDKVPGVKELKDVKAWCSVPGVKEPQDAKAWLTVPGVDNALSAIATQHAKEWVENLKKTHSREQKRDWVREAKAWINTGGSIDDWKDFGVLSLEQIDRISEVLARDKNKSKFKTLKAYVERMNDHYGYITDSSDLEGWFDLDEENGNPWETKHMWVQETGISDPKDVQAWLTVPGVKSAKDVKKWVNIGIVMNPEKAKAWLAVPGIKDPGDAKGWTDISGFTPNDAENWIKNKFTDSGSVSDWLKHGCQQPEEAMAWRDIGVTKPSDLDKWKQSSKSGENPLEVAKSWIGIGIRNPDAVWDWRNFKFEVEDAQPWGRVGVTNRKDAQAWMNKNMNPQDAQPWAEIGITNPDVADEWKNVDGVEEPSDAKEWLDAGFKESKYAQPWAEKGFNPYEAEQWNNSGFNPTYAVSFRKNGFTLDEAIEWFDAGFKEFDLIKEATAWHNKGFAPKQAQEWRAEKFDPIEAGKWLKAGLKEPADVRDLKEKYKIDGYYIKVLYCKKLRSLITDEIVKEAADKNNKSAKKFRAVSETSLNAPLKWIVAELIPLSKKVPLKFIRKCIDADIYQPDRIREEYERAKKEDKKDGREKGKENGKILKRMGFKNKKRNFDNSKELAEFWCEKAGEVWKSENIGEQGADNPMVWIDAGWSNPQKAAAWREAGWENAVDAKVWRKAGFSNPDIAIKWHKVWAENEPKRALKYHLSGFNVPENAVGVAKRVCKPTDKNIALIAALCQGLPEEDINKTLGEKKLPYEKVTELKRMCKKINQLRKVKSLWIEYKSECKKHKSYADPGEVIKLKDMIKNPSDRYKNLEKCVDSILEFLKRAKK